MRAGGRKVQEFNANVYQRYGMNCYVCGVELDDTNKSVDHLAPVSKNPELEWDINNARPCCLKHNLEKSNKTGPVRMSWLDTNFIPWSVLD